MMNLDLGCGFSKRKGFLGIDVRKNVAPDIIADLQHLPIKSNIISQIYSRRAIQHVKNKKNAFKEIHRVLKPGGKIVIIVASFWGFLFYKIGLSQSRGRYSVFHLFTKNNLTKQLKDQNFSHIRISKIKSQRNLGYDFQAIAIKQ